MGCIIYFYSDRGACTIFRVSESGKTIWMRRDEAIRTDKNGMSDSQQYTYAPNPEGIEYKASLRKDGNWRLSKQNERVVLGVRRAYHDFSF